MLPVCTFSIVAREPETGSLGVAVQSRHFDVGSRVPWAEADVGAVATQAFVDPGYGPRALAMLRKGAEAPAALAALLAADPQRELRQVAVIDARGRLAAHTGAVAVPHAGHALAKDHCVLGNMLASEDVCPAMQRGYRGAEGDLAERLLAALEAGQRAGGDLRGQQAAALLVVRAVSAEETWRNQLVDLRVEDDAAPIAELARLLHLQRAKDALDRAEAAFGRGAVDEARAAFEEGLALSGRADEFLFWGGLALARVGNAGEGEALLREALEKNPRWRTLLERLPAPLRPEAPLLARLLAQPG